MKQSRAEQDNSLPKAVLCLDSGTTRVKAAVYSTRGELLGFAEAENSALKREGSRLTQDMEETPYLEPFCGA